MRLLIPKPIFIQALRAPAKRFRRPLAWGSEAMNITKNIKKVLLALRTKGIVYKVNSKQYYSSKDKRVKTKYILFEENEWEDGEPFYSKKALLLFLVEKWKEVAGHDD